MIHWLKSLNRNERLTLLACFLGWALDSMDNQAASMLVPVLGKVFAVGKGEIGVMMTAALVASGLGGWLAGAASDRFGRLLVLQITIAWFSLGSLLCGLSQTYDQLLAARIFQGVGFGGEWAVGAVLVAEMAKPQWRATALGVVQSGYSVGLAAAAGLYFTVFSLLPETTAWRAMFIAGVAPALMIIFIRRSLTESARPAAAAPARDLGSLVRIFSRGHRRATIMGSLLCLSLQGASSAVALWLPTLLRVDRNLSVGGASSFFVLQSVGAFLGYILAARVADRIGRRGSLWIFTAGAMIVVGCLCFATLTPPVYLALAPLLGLFAFGLYSNFGPVLSEMYPAAVRGSGQGFCYNFGRGVGAIFPAMVGFLSEVRPLPLAVGGIALGAYAVACMIIFVLPETRGKALD